MLDDEGWTDYTVNQVLKTLESGSPLRHRGFFVHAQQSFASMGRVRLPVTRRLGFRRVFTPCPPLLKTRAESLSKGASCHV